MHGATLGLEALDRVVDRPEHGPLVLVVDVVVAALVGGSTSFFHEPSACFW
jgi:hypothetical protein